MSQAVEHPGHNRRMIAVTISSIAVGAAMLAAPACVFLGEKGIDVSAPVWNSALAFCRVVTGLVGLLAILSVVTERHSGSSRRDALGSVATGVVFIAAAVAGLGLVIVMTGFLGVTLVWAGGAAAIGAFHPRAGLSPGQDGECDDDVRRAL